MKYTNESASRSNDGGLVYAIIKAGFLAGTLDIIIALGHFYLKTGKNVLVVCKFIASAVYGKEAYAGGYFMPAMGLLFHYIISFAWTIFFYLIYPRIPLLAKNNIITGFLYGIFIWLVMNMVILPLTKVPKPNFQLIPSLTGMAILIAAIGLPVSILANKYYSKRDKHTSSV